MKKERIILAEGFIHQLEVITKTWHLVKVPIEKQRLMYCYCKKECKCKPWKIIVER